MGVGGPVDRREIGLGEPLRGVGHDQGHVAALGRLDRPDLAVVLDALAHPALLAQAGGVDEHDLPALHLDQRVDRVPGGARATSCTTARSSPRIAFRIELLPTFGRPMIEIAGARRRPGRPGPGARPAAAPRARPAGRRSRGRAGPTPRGRRPSPWSGGSGPRPRACQSSHLLATSMTGRPERRSRSATSMSPVVGAVCTSTTNSTRSASSIAPHGLGGDLPAHVAGVGLVDAAGVDELEGAAVPLRAGLAPVAGDPRLGVDHGVAPPGEAVEERRLAHVRIAHDRHRGLVGVEGAPGGHPARPRAGAGLGVAGLGVEFSHRRAPADPGAGRQPAAAAPATPAIMRSTAPWERRPRGPSSRSERSMRARRTPPAPARTSAGCPRWPPGPR